MPNYEGNPDVAAYGKQTRFGNGICPRAAQQRASRPWIIKKALRSLLMARFEPDIEITFELLIRISAGDLSKATGAQILAAKMFIDALNDAGALNRLIRRVEGNN